MGRAWLIYLTEHQGLQWDNSTNALAGQQHLEQ